MNRRSWRLTAAVGCFLLSLASAWDHGERSVTVPMILDHNRMLVEGQIQRKDGGWRKARFWVDTGNPEFIMNETCARDLGIEPGGAAGKKTGSGHCPNVRIGGMRLDFQGVPVTSGVEPRLWSVMHGDANLPSTVLERYQVVFDYPGRRLTIADPGSLPHRGVRAEAGVNRRTGIVQIDAVIDGERLSFALDNGASYSFASEELLERLALGHPDWPHGKGALGCANIWGLWRGEPSWPLMRLPEIQWGPVRLAGVGIAGLPRNFRGSGLGAWYSQKTAQPVAGFLGPNAFKAFRVEIDYAGGAVYFEKVVEPDIHDMDLVGLTLRPEADGGYSVIGVARKDGRPAVEGVEPGDRLLQVGSVKAMGATMGAVVDALRGRPGEIRRLILERNGRRFYVAARVERFL